jgi:type IV pilus assembly protein PilQ
MIKMQLRSNYTLLLLLLFSFQLLQGQNGDPRIEKLRTQFDLLKVDNPGLDNTVELSVNSVSLQEFIRGIANANDLNISVDKGLDLQIVNNFSNVTVSDVLLFLAKKYQLDMEFIGNIISISQYEEVQESPVEEKEKELLISYEASGDFLNLDLSNDPLEKVVKKITDVSGKNVVLAPKLSGRNVSVYIKAMPFQSAIDKFAFANGMEVTTTEDGFFLLSEKGNDQNAANNASRNSRNRNNNSAAKQREPIEGLLLEAENSSSISISAEDASIDEIIKSLLAELDVNYYLYSTLQGNKTLNLNKATLEEVLENLFEATTYTYKKVNGIYLIGERKAEGLRKTTVYQMQNRSIEEISNYIPADLKKEVEVKEFVDLNSLVISGSVPLTEELVEYLEEIDQVVPVVAIDVIIIDYRKNRSISTGLSAGLGTEPSGPTNGSILPEANFSFSASSLNNIIGNINDRTSINLGKVTPNFYFSIQALETDGIIRVRSTPKLATLNGHEASLSIGETEYYIEESNNVIGSQNPQNIITRRYQQVKADLSVTIKPFVSGNDQITLEISVEQSDFTERISAEAPPGSVTRSFTSMLRVKNNEVILLGGLEEKTTNNSGSGLPFIARIPVLRWIFGKRTKSKSKSQLNIFIKPTVIY